jgi:hypothetical protein
LIIKYRRTELKDLRFCRAKHRKSSVASRILFKFCRRAAVFLPARHRPCRRHGRRAQLFCCQKSCKNDLNPQLIYQLPVRLFQNIQDKAVKH